MEARCQGDPSRARRADEGIPGRPVSPRQRGNCVVDDSFRLHHGLVLSDWSCRASCRTGKHCSHAGQGGAGVLISVDTVSNTSTHSHRSLLLLAIYEIFFLRESPSRGRTPLHLSYACSLSNISDYSTVPLRFGPRHVPDCCLVPRASRRPIHHWVAQGYRRPLQVQVDRTRYSI